MWSFKENFKYSKRIKQIWPKRKVGFGIENKIINLAKKFCKQTAGKANRGPNEQCLSCQICSLKRQVGKGKYELNFTDGETSRKEE